MDPIAKAKESLAKAEAAGNKQQVNQLKQKLMKLEKQGVTPGGGNSSQGKRNRPQRGSRNAPVPDPIPSGNNGIFNGIISDPALRRGNDFLHLDIQGPSTRTYSEFPITDPIATKKPQTIVIEYNQFNGFNFSTFTASSEVEVVNLQLWMQQLYYKIIASIQDKRVLTSSYILTTPSDFVTVVNAICRAYLTIRSLQALLECGDLNASVSKMVQAAEKQRHIITSAMRGIGLYCLPKQLIDYLDQMVGVYQVSKDGLVLINIYDDAFTATTIPDLTSDADWTTLAGNCQFILNGIGALSESAIVIDILRLAYQEPIHFGAFPVHSSLELYNMNRTVAQSYWDTTALKMFTSPTADTGAIPVQPVWHLWNKNWPAPPPNFMSLLRVPVGSSNILTAHEILGFIASLTAGGTHYVVYTEDQVVNKITSIAAGPSTLVTITDLVSYFFPWAAPSAFELTNVQQSTIGSILAEYDVVYSTWVELCDETMVLLERIFIGGLRSKALSS